MLSSAVKKPSFLFTYNLRGERGRKEGEREKREEENTFFFKIPETLKPAAMAHT